LVLARCGLGVGSGPMWPWGRFWRADTGAASSGGFRVRSKIVQAAVAGTQPAGANERAIASRNAHPRAPAPDRQRPARRNTCHVHVMHMRSSSPRPRNGRTWLWWKWIMEELRGGDGTANPARKKRPKMYTGKHLEQTVGSAGGSPPVAAGAMPYSVRHARSSSNIRANDSVGWRRASGRGDTLLQRV